jgi:N-carbamoylputrescine amidase
VPRLLTIAVTETINAYPDMPDRVDDLPLLEGRLEEIRRANVDHHLALIAQAAERGVKAIGLGELFTGPYFALTQHPMWRSLAEDARSGPTVTALSEAAARHQVVIVAPIYELEATSGRRFNTAVVIDAGGEVLGKYRKMHIPEGENEQGRFLEPYYYQASAPGLENRSIKNRSSNPYFPVFETAAAKIGVSICYDRHFEGVVRSLAAAGAELIFSPAVTFGNKSARMWALEFEVDAARHNVFIAGSNRRGQERPWNQPYFGDSHVVGPNGRVAAKPSPEGLVIAEIDLDQLSAGDPSGWKLTRDRRPGDYSP